MIKIKALFRKYREILSYLTVGVLTTLVSWGSFAFFQLLFGGLISDNTVCASLSNVLSWVIAVLFSFAANKLWVFESKSWQARLVTKELVSFVVSRVATGLLEWFGLPLLINIGLGQAIFGIEGMLAKILVSIIVVILNYVFGKLFVFKKKKTVDVDDTDENTENEDDGNGLIL